MPFGIADRIGFALIPEQAVRKTLAFEIPAVMTLARPDFVLIGGCAQSLSPPLGEARIRPLDIGSPSKKYLLGQQNQPASIDDNPKQRNALERAIKKMGLM